MRRPRFGGVEDLAASGILQARGNGTFVPFHLCREDMVYNNIGKMAWSK